MLTTIITCFHSPLVLFTAKRHTVSSASTVTCNIQPLPLQTKQPGANDDIDNNINFHTPVSSKTTISIKEALETHYKTANASIQRGKCTHELGRLATSVLDESRKYLISNFCSSKLLSSKPQLIFTYSSIDAHQLLKKCTSYTLIPDDEILLCAHLNDEIIQTWKRSSTATDDVKINLVSSSNTLDQPNIEHYVQFLSNRMRIVVLPLISPITGAIAPLGELVPFFRGVGAVTIVDATNYSCSCPDIELIKKCYEEWCVDFILCEIKGAGCFIIGDEKKWDSLPPVVGGERTLMQYNFNDLNILEDRNNWAPLPFRFECETSMPTIAAAVSAACNNMNLRNENNVNILIERLKDGLNDLNEKYVFVRIDLYVFDNDNNEDINIENIALKYMQCCLNVQIDDMNRNEEIYGCLSKVGIECGLCLSDGYSQCISHGILPVQHECLRLNLNTEVHTEKDIDQFIEILHHSITSFIT